MLLHRIFGLSIFDTGLTKYEMNKLTKIKLISTIICENLPQLLLQLLYFVQFGFESSTSRDATLLAFVGSILSVILSVLVWYINRKEQWVKPIIYYIEFSKKRKLKLHDVEREKFVAKRSIRQQLIMDLCTKVFNVSTSVIQISYVSIIDCGIIIRFVHFVDDKDLMAMQQSLRGTKRGTKYDEYNDMFTGISPQYYTKSLFKQHRGDILALYYEFYELNKVSNFNLFQIKYHNDLPLSYDTNKVLATTQLNVLDSHSLATFTKDNGFDSNNVEMTEVNAVVSSLKDEVVSLKKQLNTQTKKKKKLMKLIYMELKDDGSDIDDNADALITFGNSNHNIINEGSSNDDDSEASAYDGNNPITNTNNTQYVQLQSPNTKDDEKYQDIIEELPPKLAPKSNVLGGLSHKL